VAASRGWPRYDEDKVCSFMAYRKGLKVRYVIVLLAMVCPGLLFAQFGGEFAAMNSLEKGKWEKAKVQFAKVIRKDSLNAGAHYGLSLYFFTSGNPNAQIDSAYRYAMKTLAYYKLSSTKQRERYRRLPLDSVILVRHRERIDSAAFERAKSTNTEFGYIDFLSRFPLAVQQVRAMELRDEVAYLDALKENTYGSFFRYLEKYPESSRANEANVRYEKLLYEAKTKDKKLSSYELFLSQYTSSPYLKEVERHIFEISTASGEMQSFEKFLKKYPESSSATKARNILYHLYREEDRAIPTSFLNDSIRRLQTLEKYYLVPFLKGDLFGFMNEHGEEIIKPSVKEISNAFMCGNIMEELLVLENKIIARNGSILFQGEIIEVEELGFGFIKVTTPTCIKIIHYSGYRVGNDGCFQDGNMLGKNYLVIQKEKRWSVWSLAGRMLLPFEWEDVQLIGDVVALRKAGKVKLARLKDLVKPADQVSITLTREYHEVKSWPNGMVWVKLGNEQGVLNQNLNEWISLSKQELTPTFFGAMSQFNSGYKLHDKTSISSPLFHRVKVSQPWVGVQQGGLWRLIDPATKKFQSTEFDSVGFIGPFAMGLRNDSLRVYLSKSNFVESLQTTKVQFIPGKDSLFFLLLDEGDQKTLFDTKGNRLFTVNFDRIEYNNEGFFTVIKKEKRGLISLDGRTVVQPEFDAMGTVNHGVVAILKDKKFGFLDVVHKKEIKPEYDKNILRYSATKMIAFKNGFYGLIGWDNKPTTLFEFEEIRYWNDSSALVKKNFNWIIYNFVEKKIVLNKIKTFKWVLDTDREKIMIVQQENAYGVISNKRGVIIPATFTDIVNLGSATVPLYFTEKHVEEAAIFVVIYYDRNGVQLRKQVYETDDYEKIYCSDSQ